MRAATITSLLCLKHGRIKYSCIRDACLKVMKAESSRVLRGLVQSMKPRAAASSCLLSVWPLSTFRSANSANDISVHTCHHFRGPVKDGWRSKYAADPPLLARLHLRWLHTQPDKRCFTTGVASTDDCGSQGGAFARPASDTASATGADGRSVTVQGTASGPDVDGRHGGVTKEDRAALQRSRRAQGVGAAEGHPAVETLLQNLPWQLQQAQESDKALHLVRV